MKVTFLGTGTSMGVPVAGGFGKEMIKGDPRNQRTRCSAWVQTEQSSVVIDTGPEFRIQTLRSNVNRIDLVLITHEHMDHIAGLDDLRSFNYAQKAPIPLFSSGRAIRSIENRFDYMFGENKYPGSTSVEMSELTESTRFRDIRITPLPYSHGATQVLGFRLNDFSYLTDVKSIPDETREKVRGSRVMVLSGLRWEPGHPTHLTIPEAVEIATELEIPETYLIHMNSYVDHEESNRRLPPHVQLAYDQLEITI
ncbi:MBL fold metallo-hydrolase [Rhodohalobacter mucosus]|uniref:MBL fold metallo-hydrolase n=1 Tax=Rhodohalobacter mucosus TaxID=2079485 RepID=A0A316TMV4_9BACT|nr:MBL fold metallo-hydrolase [Rhodohalobacter mucosus]PWN05943.1 MBL fold metallo-hydrolase [Rhodohalobacter mucosus]